MPKKSSGLLKKRRFRKRDLLFVAAIFSLIGMIAIISSFAATFTTVEAESLQYKFGSNTSAKVGVVAGQNGGKASALYWSGAGTGTVALPTKTTSVTVYAKGDQCQGAPQMTVTVDGRQIGNQAVTATTWKSYQIPVNIEPGSHSVAVGFTNDAVAVVNGSQGKPASRCDRNLYVDRLVFTGLDKPATLTTTVQAETMTAPLSAITEGQTKADKARIFYQNATARAQIALPNNVNEMRIVAKGDQCQGAPNLQVKVDGKQVASRAISSKGWGEYSASVTIPAGTHTIETVFTNDVYIAATKCDRNLYIDQIKLIGPAPTPKPTPTPPATSTPAPTKPTTPAAQPVQTYHPSAPYTIIMIGWRPYEKEYAQLANTKTNLVFRSIERTPNSKTGKWTKMDEWDRSQYRYYSNVAGSDWASSGPGGACKNTNLAYMDQRYADEVLNRGGNIGYYMHEMVSLYAACNGWNWTQAAQQMNWAQVHHWMMQARSQGKKVIWSEPAQGWNAIANNPSFQAYSVHWKTTLVPMFATNFRTPGGDHVPAARAGASSVARSLGTPLGESVQSWYFREGFNDLSTTGTVNLANYGLQAGSTYYQIEGTWGDMAWGTDYMKGILAFSRQLGPAGSPVPAPPVPVVAPAAPKPAAVNATKKPIYQLWSAVQSDHVYTNSESEKNQLKAKGFEDQGITGYIYDKQVAGSAPLYRLYSAGLTDHFYTNSENQRSQAKAGGGKYVDEGVVGYVMSSQVAGSTPLYQLYSASYPDHFYTAQTWSRDNAKASFRKYVDRGNAGYIFLRP